MTVEPSDSGLVVQTDPGTIPPAAGAPATAGTGLSNPPGQVSLTYRLGTYQTFLAAMLARIPTQTVPGPDPDVPLRPLANLTTREGSDLTIALLDAWAIVCDIITFYQERNANEGFLRTALERRSVVDLAGEIGYTFRPGVAASTPLAFTISATAAPVGTVVAAGTQVQSAPSGGKGAQVFETSRPIRAYPTWNALTPALTRPQVVASGATSLDLAGTATRLRPGQPIVICEGSTPVDFRLLRAVQPDAANNVTRVSWGGALSTSYTSPQVAAFRGQSTLFGYNAPPWASLPDAIKAQYGDNVPTAITSVAYAPDGETVVSGQINGSLTIWSVANNLTPVTTIPNAHTSVLAVAYAPDGSAILTGGADGLVKLWDTRGNLLQTLTGHTGPVNGVTFSPQYVKGNADDVVASASADRTVRIWTLANPTTPVVCQGHTQAVNAVAFSPAGQELLSGSDDRSAIRWTLQGGAIQTYDGPQGQQGAIKCVAYTPTYATDGSFVTGGADNNILWWVNTSAYPTQTYSGHTSIVTGVSFSPGYATNHLLLSCSLDQTVIAWEQGTKTVLREHVMGVNGVMCSPVAGSAWAVSGSTDTTLVLWNLSGMQAVAVGTQLSTYSEWPGFALNPNAIDLATTEPSVIPGSLLALWTGDGSTVAICSVEAAQPVARSDFMLSARVTRVTPVAPVGNPAAFPLRDTTVAIQSETLALAATSLGPEIPPCHVGLLPLMPAQPRLPASASARRGGANGDRARAVIAGSDQEGDDATPTIQLAQLVTGLQSGQQLALSGQQFDCATRRPTGQQVSEVVTLLGTELTPDKSATVLQLTQPTTYQYVRSTLVINANVAMATNGQTVANEILGSGDATQRNQRFTLKRSPLTYVSDATATGSRDTLQVFVDGVQWTEVPGFYGQDGQARVYTVRTDASGQTSVRFGDGVNGARLPSGTENVSATYRVGSGPSGEVNASTLNQLMSASPAISAVTNPEAATGAASPDTRDSARARAPLTVVTLGRIVSLDDYNDMAEAFAGISRAKTRLLWNGRGQVIHITILGERGEPISDESLLYQSLVQEIDAVREPAQPVVVQSGDDLIRQFNVTARIVAMAGYRAMTVQAAAEAALKLRFSFEKSAFGRGVAASDVISVIQGTPGVLAVDLIAFHLTGPDSRPSLAAYLAPRSAQWDASAGEFIPDQLLVVNGDDGIRLTVEGGA